MPIHYTKLILTGTNPGDSDIFPDTWIVFYHASGLGEYLQDIYDSEESFHQNRLIQAPLF
jgi:hypothetical protein